jgi:uncharacterized ParB-like nuclease family protein
MTDSEYLRLLESSIKKLDALRWQREEIDVEMAKLQQFIQATVNLLPDEATNKYKALLAEMNKETEMASAGLTDAIRSILQRRYPAWLSVTNVRDALVAAAFDFSSYKSNPLAAISTTLRRLAKSDDVETTEIDNVNAYRMASTLAKIDAIVATLTGTPRKK